MFLHTQLTNELLRHEQLEQGFQRERQLSQEAKRRVLELSKMHEEDYHSLDHKTQTK